LEGSTGLYAAFGGIFSGIGQLKKGIPAIYTNMRYTPNMNVKRYKTVRKQKPGAQAAAQGIAPGYREDTPPTA